MSSKRRRQERFYCKVCNAWTQGDGGSVRAHLNGFRHRGNVREQEKNTKRDQDQRRRQEVFVAKELEKLDKVAREKVGSVARVVALEGQQEEKGAVQHRAERLEGVKEVEEEPAYQVFEDQVLGQYEIDGVTYLEGILHEDLLSVGQYCQVARVEPSVESTGEIEGADEQEEVWQAAVVVGSKKCLSKDNLEVYRALEVKFERDGKVEIIRSQDARVIAPKPPPLKFQRGNETEGIPGSEWQAVEVKIGAEKDIALEPRKKISPEEAKELLNPSSDGRSRFEQHDEGDDAYATFNPFGGSYKGFNVSDAEITTKTISTPEPPPTSETNAKPTLRFKKRRKGKE